jgi:hypothetical protein
MKLTITLWLLACALLCTPSRAADKPGTMPLNKLTFSYYHFSSGKDGVDLNLRHTFKSSTAWIGGYHESDGFDQLRLGYEYDYHHEWLTVVPSVLGATHGFLGASLYAEAGHRLFGIAGAGRTNLRPYWNLSFDPNDYIQGGLGYRDESGNTLSVYAIRDNRLKTGQTNTHVYVRRYLPHEWRLTVDLVREQGHGDEGFMIKAWAETADVDWRRWFARVAWDPHVNYSSDHQFRIATGLRF